MKKEVVDVVHEDEEKKMKLEIWMKSWRINQQMNEMNTEEEEED